MYVYVLDLTFKDLNDVRGNQGFIQISGAGFLDFIKLFYFPIVIQLLIIIALVGFMHVVFEPFV
jgi:hypothetical protein